MSHAWCVCIMHCECACLSKLLKYVLECTCLCWLYVTDIIRFLMCTELIFVVYSAQELSGNLGLTERIPVT